MEEIIASIEEGTYIRPYYKHAAFKSEAEWRMVYTKITCEKEYNEKAEEYSILGISFSNLLSPKLNLKNSTSSSIVNFGFGPIYIVLDYAK
mgnify:CR=1 FL=1